MNLEYRIVDKKYTENGFCLTAAKATELLNEMAAEGWELVLLSDWLQWWIFKREKKA